MRTFLGDLALIQVHCAVEESYGQRQDYADEVVPGQKQLSSEMLTLMHHLISHESCTRLNSGVLGLSLLLDSRWRPPIADAELDH